KLDVVREGRSRAVDVKLAERPDEREPSGRTPSRSGSEKEQGDLLGLSVQDVTPQLARRSQVDASTRGAVVVDVAQDSPAADAGVLGERRGLLRLHLLRRYPGDTGATTGRRVAIGRTGPSSGDPFDLRRAVRDDRCLEKGERERQGGKPGGEHGAQVALHGF